MVTRLCPKILTNNTICAHAAATLTAAGMRLRGCSRPRCVTVGDRLAGPGPAGAAPEPPVAASHLLHHHVTPRRYTRTRAAPTRPLSRHGRAAATAATAAAAAAAMPGTRAVGPPPSARSVTRIAAPESTEQATRGVSRAIGWGGWGASSSCDGGCAPPRRPRSCPRSPPSGRRRGAAAPTQIPATGRSHGVGMAGSG